MKIVYFFERKILIACLITKDWIMSLKTGKNTFSTGLKASRKHKRQILIQSCIFGLNNGTFIHHLRRLYGFFRLTCQIQLAWRKWENKTPKWKRCYLWNNLTSTKLNGNFQGIYYTDVIRIRKVEFYLKKVGN